MDSGNDLQLASYWILTNLAYVGKEKQIKDIPCGEIYQDFSQQLGTALDKLSFGKLVHYLFPELEMKIGKERCRKSIKYYCGLNHLGPPDPHQIPLDMISASSHLITQHGFNLLGHDNSDHGDHGSVHLAHQTLHSVNGQTVFVSVKFARSSVGVSVATVDVDIQSYGFPHGLEWSTVNLNALAQAVKGLRLCRGKPFNEGATVRLMPSLLIETWNGERRVRTTKCTRTLPLLTISSTCIRCRKLISYARTARERPSAPPDNDTNTDPAFRQKRLLEKVKSVVQESAASMSSGDELEDGAQVVKEGKAEIFSPAQVFYNPVQEFNRDLTISVISEHIRDHFKTLRERQDGSRKPKLEEESASAIPPEDLADPETAGIKYPHGVKILEALSASGLRSVRFALEIPGIKEIITNDFDENAVRFIRKNVAHNGVADIVTPNCADASMIMYQNRKISERFDVIDLDPYGSAAPFLDAAVQALKDGGLLCVTCTDMAVMAGNTPETCHSKYQAISLKAKFCHEQGLRILLQCIDSHANRYSRCIVPVLSISADFYIRVFVRIYSGQNRVKHSVSKLSMVYNCVGCGRFTMQPISQKTPTNDKGDYKFTPAHGPAVESACASCGSRHTMGGPMWSARLHDVDFVQRVIRRVGEHKDKFGTADRIRGVLSVVTEELQDVPLYYVNDELNRILHCQPMKMIDLRSAILNAGYEVSFSHAHKNSVKTTAPMDVLWDIYRCWVKTNPVKAARLQDGSPAKAILSIEPNLEVDFSEHPEANPKSRRQGLLRWQHNPVKDWGPKARATKGEGADINFRRNKGLRKAKKRKVVQDVEFRKNMDLKTFPCKRFKLGKCSLGDACKYSHELDKDNSVPMDLDSSDCMLGVPGEDDCEEDIRISAAPEDGTTHTGPSNSSSAVL